MDWQNVASMISFKPSCFSDTEIKHTHNKKNMVFLFPKRNYYKDKSRAKTKKTGVTVVSAAPAFVSSRLHDPIAVSAVSML